MDEILIEDKKYVSSKRAAKATGYAKDYIGQLCREGRVPARLVGRSWYVLESAIHDHRFGNPEPKTEDSTTDRQVTVSNWESPRYEASKPEILPSINRLRPISVQTEKEDTPVADSQDSTTHALQDSWGAWFDRVTDTEPIAKQAEMEPEIIEMEEEEVSIPIHTVYELPPENFLPHRVEAYNPQEMRKQEKKGNGMRAFQVAGGVLAVLVAVLAVIGTGYFDAYIISSGQASSISGVLLYNR